MALIVVYGKPGSGKSTLCGHLRTADQSIRVWSFDETTVVDGETEKERRRKAQTRSISGIATHPDTLHLVDDVLYLQSMRRPFERLSRSLAMEYGTIYVEASIEESIERDHARPGSSRVGEECIRRIEERLERSTVGEEVVYRSTDDLPRISRWLSELRRRGEEKRLRRDEERGELTSQSSPLGSSINLQTETDLQLRKIITQLCKGGADGRVLAEVKKTLLEETRREGRMMSECEMRRRFEEMIRSTVGPLVNR